MLNISILQLYIYFTNKLSPVISSGLLKFIKSSIVGAKSASLPDFNLTANDLKDFVEDGKAIKDIYLSAYKELDKIVDCLQNDTEL